jgi:hypothetical protein
MNTYTLQLSNADLSVMFASLIDEELALKTAIANERLCTNNEDTIASLWHDLIRIDSIKEQLIKQMGNRK